MHLEIFYTVVESPNWKHVGLIKTDDHIFVIVDDADRISAYLLKGDTPSIKLISQTWQYFGFGTSGFPMNAPTAVQVKGYHNFCEHPLIDESFYYHEAILEDFSGEDF